MISVLDLWHMTSVLDLGVVQLHLEIKLCFWLYTILLLLYFEMFVQGEIKEQHISVTVTGILKLVIKENDILNVKCCYTCITPTKESQNQR